MKRFLITLTLAMLFISASAQKDITKFLGIPVDGTKTEMIQKLKAKGFTQSRTMEGALEGQFNGRDVYVSVVTNNNKVYRIVVIDKYTSDESSIKIRFNTLCSQFDNNSNYITIGDFSIPENENIAYEIMVNKKQIQAAYYQRPTNIDSSDFLSDEYREAASKKSVWFLIVYNYGEYRIVMYYDNIYNQANGEDL